MTIHDLLPEMTRTSKRIARLRRQLELPDDEQTDTARCPDGMPHERFEKLKANLDSAEDAAGKLSSQFLSQMVTADPAFEDRMKRAAEHFDANKARWAQMPLGPIWPAKTAAPPKSDRPAKAIMFVAFAYYL
jgi:hypothetical protein